MMPGGLITEPEFGSLNRQPRDYALIVAHAEEFFCAERGLVKLHGAGAAADAEPGRYRGRDRGCRLATWPGRGPPGRSLALLIRWHRLA